MRAYAVGLIALIGCGGNGASDDLPLAVYLKGENVTDDLDADRGALWAVFADADGSADFSTEIQITDHFGAWEQDWAAPQMSPDGVFMSYVDSNGPTRMIVPSNGSGDPRAVSDGNAVTERVSWSPSQPVLAIAGESKLDLHDPVTNQSIASIGYASGSVDVLTWSGDGTTIVARIIDGNSELATLYVATTDGVTAAIAGTNPEYPRLSVDGSRLAWLDDGRLMVANRDGSGLSDVGAAQSLGWVSPRGDRFYACTAIECTLYGFDGSPTALSEQVPWGADRWSYDGSTLYIEAGSLYAIDVASGAVVDQGSVVAWGQPSPDGAWVPVRVDAQAGWELKAKDGAERVELPTTKPFLIVDDWAGSTFHWMAIDIDESVEGGALDPTNPSTLKVFTPDKLDEVLEQYGTGRGVWRIKRERVYDSSAVLIESWKTTIFLVDADLLPSATIESDNIRSLPTLVITLLVGRLDAILTVTEFETDTILQYHSWTHQYIRRSSGSLVSATTSPGRWQPQ